MSDPANPFQSPTSDESALDASGEAPIIRAQSPLVIGIIAIVFAVLLGLIGGVAGMLVMSAMPTTPQQQQVMAQMGMSPDYLLFQQIAMIVISGVELVAGIFLVRYKRLGLTLFNLYAGLMIVHTVGNTAYTVYAMSGMFEGEAAIAGVIGGIIGGILGSVFNLIFPIIGLILMNRDDVKISLN